MKNQRILSWALLLGLLIFVSSCQKDRLVPTEAQSAESGGTDGFWEGFNKMGPRMEQAFSYAVKDELFAFQVVDMTQEMRTGDFEILLPEFFASQMHDGRNTKEVFLKSAEGIITPEELDEFLVQYPSALVAVRGNPKSWLLTDYTAPVMFLPHGFNERSETIQASRLGEKVTLDLTKPFQDAVVAIHISERHDLAGNRIIPTNNEVLTKTSQPGLNLNDVNPGGAGVQAFCAPEPTSCTQPTITSFTATPENGAVKLQWTASGFSTSLCNWGRIRIKRYNPNGTTTNWLRFVDDGNLFYDNSGGPNVTYTYEIDLYIAYKSNSSTNPGNWETCRATNNLQQRTAVYPAPTGPVDTYRGTNQASNSIRYDWSAPTGASISEYRIRRATPSGYVTLATGLSGFTTSYFWNPGPASFPGQMIETQIQYRSAGSWQGAFFDRTYASYRNPGQPFKYYGIRMSDVTAFEFNENNTTGAPEIRLVALQANAAETPIILAETFLPMSPCTETEIIILPWFGAYPITRNTGYFFPTDAPDGFTILSSWNSDLAGSAIRIRTWETDLNVPRVTEQTNVNSNETNLSAKFGFKLFKAIGVDIGVESTWKNTTTEKILFPVDDLPIADNLVYYHENPTTVVGTQLFGNINFSNRCTNLENNL